MKKHKKITPCKCCCHLGHTCKTVEYYEQGLELVKRWQRAGFPIEGPTREALAEWAKERTPELASTLAMMKLSDSFGLHEVFMKQKRLRSVIDEVNSLLRDK